MKFTWRNVCVLVKSSIRSFYKRNVNWQILLQLNFFIDFINWSKNRCIKRASLENPPNHFDRSEPIRMAVVLHSWIECTKRKWKFKLAPWTSKLAKQFNDLFVSKERTYQLEPFLLYAMWIVLSTKSLNPHRHEKLNSCIDEWLERKKKKQQQILAIEFRWWRRWNAIDLSIEHENIIFVYQIRSRYSGCVCAFAYGHAISHT